MEENCSSGARAAKVQNQYATHGRYEEFINKFLYAFTASAFISAWVLQEHCSAEINGRALLPGGDSWLT